jgi:hypothetical protein
MSEDDETVLGASQDAQTNRKPFSCTSYTILFIAIYYSAAISLCALIGALASCDGNSHPNMMIAFEL